MCERLGADRSGAHRNPASADPQGGTPPLVRARPGRPRPGFLLDRPDPSWTMAPAGGAGARDPEGRATDDQLRAVLARVPAFRDGVALVEPLPGGLTNRNYRVEVGGDCYVLRVAGADTELLGIDRARELACCRAAAEAGIGPDVIAFLPEHSALVTRFVSGRVLAADDARDPGALRRVAAVLRRCPDHP